jgi:hypothetical protein
MANEMGTNEMGTNEMGTNEMGTNEMGTNEMGTNEMGTNEMGTNEMGTNENDISPRRLTMVSMGNNCMFCKGPQGESYITYVALESKMGYISCKECRVKMKAAVEFWRTHRAYGKANYLKDRTDLKIRRTNGVIEEGWHLNNPLVRHEDDGHVSIYCYNIDYNIGKWCRMETILELNP